MILFKKLNESLRIKTPYTKGNTNEYEKYYVKTKENYQKPLLNSKERH